MKNGRYRVSIGFKKQRFYLGTYKEFEEAVQARLEAEKIINEGFLEAYYRWQEQGEEGMFHFDVEKEGQEFKVTSRIS